MNPALLAILRLDSPWLDGSGEFPGAAAGRYPTTFHPRHMLESVDWPVAGQAHLIVGPRQVGKSTLLWEWFRATDLPPLFVDAEQPAVREWASSAAGMAHDIANLVPATMPVLIDEAQHLAEAGLLIKGLVDRGLPNPLFVTGSSAFHLRARTRESLAGRAVRYEVHPFSLGEVGVILGDSPPLIRAARHRELARRQMVFGGYPAAWLAERPEPILARLLDAFVIRDASDLFRVQHLDAFRRLLRLLAGQIGSLVNYAEWASICGVSASAVGQYVEVLAEAGIVQAIRPFVGGRRAEVTSRPKVYFRDNGLRNAVTQQFGAFTERPDRGALLENWLFAELRKHLSPLAPMDVIHYWRSKNGAEVDFVLPRPGGLLAFEAKAAELRRPKLSRSARSFIAAYQPRRFFVVNLALEAVERIGETEVRWVGPEVLAEPEGLGI